LNKKDGNETQAENKTSRLHLQRFFLAAIKDDNCSLVTQIKIYALRFISRLKLSFFLPRQLLQNSYNHPTEKLLRLTSKRDEPKRSQIFSNRKGVFYKCKTQSN